MNTQNDIDSWVSALEAVGILSTKLGGHEQAKTDLLSRIRDGVLESRAQYICQEADARKIDLENLDWDDYRLAEPHKEQIDKTFLRPRHNQAEFVRVPNDFFIRSDGWTIDSERCHWDRSLIVATRSAQLRALSRQADPKAGLLIRRFAFRLEFPKKVIDSLAGIEATVINETTWDAPLLGSKKRPNAGRPRSDSWNDWVAEVAAYTHENGFDSQKSARVFYDEVGDRMAIAGKESPEFETVEKAIGAIKRRMIEVMHTPDS